MKLVSLIPILFFTLIACNKKMSTVSMKSGIKTIEYHYIDSSVPPVYHRSYTITASKDSICLLVNSYGTVITDEFFPSDANTFNNLLSLFEDCAIASGENKEDHRGCAGGTGEEIVLTGNERVVFKASVYHCGNENYGTLRGDSHRFGTAMKALIPDFQSKLKKNG